VNAAEHGARERLVAAARRLSDAGLNPRRSGNVSERFGTGFLITPSALPYDRTGPDDMVLVEGDGAAHGPRKPSEVAFAGGRDIRCAGYATFGTAELSDEALVAIEDRRACLLANHGVVAFGDSVWAAVELADKVEALARLYWQALQVGEPVLLDEVEMDRVVGKFTTYGTIGRPPFSLRRNRESFAPFRLRENGVCPRFWA
jgi:L-fuculose-phosphate aldolase